ncbi:unnamed protein product, partial [Amoebophrya sp. A25]
LSVAPPGALTVGQLREVHRKYFEPRWRDHNCFRSPGPLQYGTQEDLSAHPRGEEDPQQLPFTLLSQTLSATELAAAIQSDAEEFLAQSEEGNDSKEQCEMREVPGVSQQGDEVKRMGASGYRLAVRPLQPTLGIAPEPSTSTDGVLDDKTREQIEARSPQRQDTAASAESGGSVARFRWNGGAYGIEEVGWRRSRYVVGVRSRADDASSGIPFSERIPANRPLNSAKQVGLLPSSLLQGGSVDTALPSKFSGRLCESSAFNRFYVTIRGYECLSALERQRIEYEPRLPDVLKQPLQVTDEDMTARMCLDSMASVFPRTANLQAIQLRPLKQPLAYDVAEAPLLAKAQGDETQDLDDLVALDNLIQGALDSEMWNDETRAAAARMLAASAAAEDDSLANLLALNVSRPVPSSACTERTDEGSRSGVPLLHLIGNSEGGAAARSALQKASGSEESTAEDGARKGSFSGVKTGLVVHQTQTRPDNTTDSRPANQQDSSHKMPGLPISISRESMGTHIQSERGLPTS